MAFSKFVLSIPPMKKILLCTSPSLSLTITYLVALFIRLGSLISSSLSSRTTYLHKYIRDIGFSYQIYGQPHFPVCAPLGRQSEPEGFYSLVVVVLMLRLSSQISAIPPVRARLGCE
jgi:hypothetical protein